MEPHFGKWKHFCLLSAIINIPSQITHRSHTRSVVLTTHPQIKVVFVIHTALLLDSIVIKHFHHSSNAKIIISLVSRLLCNNMYSGIGAPLVRHMLSWECLLSGKVKLDWSPPPTHQWVTEGYPEAQPASETLIITRTQLIWHCNRAAERENDRVRQTQLLSSPQSTFCLEQKGIYRLAAQLL